MSRPPVSVIALHDGHARAAPGEVPRRREPGGAGSHDGDARRVSCQGRGSVRGRRAPTPSRRWRARCLTVTGWPSTVPRLHAASHRAGHTRLVNSGRGEVSARRSAAARPLRPRQMSSFHSGMRLCSGHPLVRARRTICPIDRKATPHIMQRLACSRRTSSPGSRYSGSKSRVVHRSAAGRGPA